ncbi:MAG: YceI family protein [Kofleriaceae bacterium]|nr:YceI family protein [Kofleriaceae bacterium]
MRSVYAPVLLPLAALLAALVRWALQGSWNVYTALEKRFYVPDPDLGWRIAPEHPIWLGLDACAIIAAIAFGLAIGGYVLTKLEERRERPVRILRVAAWVVAAVPLVIPVAAFVTGGAPAGARDMLPAAQAVKLETGIAGALASPAGRYDLAEHTGNTITARVSAGGEAFDARFARGIAGTLRLDPHDLTKAVHAEVSVPTASVDTGIGERSKHAREGYLLAHKYPQLAFTLDQVVAARQETPSVVAFRARGRVTLIGKTHDVEVTGTLGKPDAAALARLGLSGEVLLVTAQFSLVIRDTALAPDAGDFDGDRIPIQVSLVLRHTGELES